MKKIIGLIILLVSVFSLSSCKSSERIYCVQEYKSLIYDELRLIDFNIYTNSRESILFDDENNAVSLEFCGNIYNYTNIDTEKIEVEDGKFICSFSLPMREKMKNMCGIACISFSQKGIEVNIEVGIIDIIFENMELLSFNQMYGIYSKIDNALLLVAINLVICNIEYITEFHIGTLVEGNLNKALFDTTIPNETNINEWIIDYNLFDSPTRMTLSIRKNRVVIPLSYSNKYIIKTGVIILASDDSLFFIDTFDYLNNILSDIEYKDFIKEGVLYVRN